MALEIYAAVKPSTTAQEIQKLMLEWLSKREIFFQGFGKQFEEETLVHAEAIQRLVASGKVIERDRARRLRFS